MNSKIKINWKEALRKYLPQNIFNVLSKLGNEFSDSVEEIRLRVSKPLMVYTCDKGYFIGTDGVSGSQRIIVETDDVEMTFNAITGKSPYAYEDEIRQGFLTLENGIRAGIAGSASQSEGNTKIYKSISGINFRIPREAVGISKKLLQYISTGNRLLNTLVISSPKLGKTTLVRDIARCAGNGLGLPPLKVSLIDERQELAASVYGRPLFDVGVETDVISGVLKHQGAFMALRSLSPDVIVTDEIGKSADLEALREVANAGVAMVTTAHAPDLKGLLNRLFFRKIFDERLFDMYVVLSAALGRITVAQIHDNSGCELLKEPFRLEEDQL